MAIRDFSPMKLFAAGGVLAAVPLIAGLWVNLGMIGVTMTVVGGLAAIVGGVMIMTSGR